MKERMKMSNAFKFVTLLELMWALCLFIHAIAVKDLSILAYGLYPLAIMALVVFIVRFSPQEDKDE